MDDWIRDLISRYDGRSIKMEEIEREGPNIRILGENED